jgi:hypothetical protein
VAAASSSSGKPYVATPHAMAGALPTSASGDIYTKVAIPRSKSFMNVNSQYNLQELFRELKEKEGVESIDDVLKKIITPNGISFNEIKPVYRELLLKLAMTMSQDEIFQRSKNILSQEKKKEKKTKKTVEKKSKPKKESSEAGGSSTLSSFFKMTFSSSAASSKNNSLAPSKKVGTATSASSSGYDSSSAFGGRSSLPSSKPLPAVPGSSLAKKATINKADISGPMPINGSVKPPLISPDSISTRLGKPGSINNNNDESVDDAYGSCSECGYESVCNYDSCSCRVKIPPPKEYQSLANIVRGGGATLSKTNTLRSASNRTATTALPSSESEEVYNECSGESCISTEKCYCSLRGDPRLGPHQQQHRHHGGLSEKLSVSNRRHTTIIHCNGDAGPTNSSSSSSCCCCAKSSAAKDGCSCAKRALHASASHLAQSSSCSSSASTSSSSAYSSEAASCCSLRRGAASSSAGSLLSACESPQTAWRRNTRMVVAHPHAHHEPVARKTSASSGSDCSCACSCNNNSNAALSKSHENVLVYSSSGSSTCSSSFCSHRSAPLQLHVPKNYVGGGGTMRRAGSKVLLVSAVDTAGRVSTISI